MGDAMNPRERTLAFLAGAPVDHPPFHPLVMQYAATKTGIVFRDYCLDHRKQCYAMIEFARKYGMDYLHPAGFPYGEASAYGVQLVYPEDGIPYPVAPLIVHISQDLDRIRPLNIEGDAAMMNRVDGVNLYHKTVGDEFFIAAHCEGPLAEYTDLRGVQNGLVDLLVYPELVKNAMSIITENAKKWIYLQVQAGADCVSIGDAICSQISPSLYRKMVKPLHQELINFVKALGVYSKLHICGDISPILPDLIEIGTNIIDIDHMVQFDDALLSHLHPHQVLCGNIDPVAEIRFGTPASIEAAVARLRTKGNGKIIISGGCEIPQDTPEENYLALQRASYHSECTSGCASTKP